jgi:DNA-binding response OmpR family regulator
MYDFNMLHQLVYRLRRKIEPDQTSPRYVEAVAGVGYKLQIGRSESSSPRIDRGRS